MILWTFQHFDRFTYWVSPLAGRLHGSGGVRTGALRRMRRAGSHASLRAGGRDMAALQLVGIAELFVRRHGNPIHRPLGRSLLRLGLARGPAIGRPWCRYAGV